MRNVAEYSWTASRLRHATKPWAALVAAATVLGASLSIAAPEASAYEFNLTPSSQGAGGAPVTAPPAGGQATTATIASAISGLDNEKPSLRFAVTTSGTQPVTALTVVLPSGLSFSGKASNLAHGVRTTGTDKPHSTVRDGQLTVTLKRGSPTVNLTIGAPALTESKRFERSIETLVAFNRAHKGDERSVSLKFTVTVEIGTIDSVKVPVTIAY
jgi:hypothetical protein